jgi:hypothetical protein
MARTARPHLRVAGRLDQLSGVVDLLRCQFLAYAKFHAAALRILHAGSGTGMIEAELAPGRTDTAVIPGSVQ